MPFDLSVVLSFPFDHFLGHRWFRDRLCLEIEILQQQHREAMVADKEMSKKIEILKDELVEKENTIMNLRKKNTMFSTIMLSLLCMSFDLSSTSFSRSVFFLVSSPISFSTNKRYSVFFCGKRDNSNLNIDIYFSI
jgi:hypothetical protein